MPSLFYGGIMPRPCCLRHVDVNPCAISFRPTGIPVHLLDIVVLALDELEALRLADLGGLYQEAAAKKMKISRPTFARIVEAARRKVADALIHGKAIRLEGGAVAVKRGRTLPGTEGSGPTCGGRGVGRGPCGCGLRRVGQTQNGAAPCPHGRRRSGVACAAVKATQRGRISSNHANQGEQES
jgi:uncharacterized protein